MSRQPAKRTASKKAAPSRAAVTPAPAAAFYAPSDDLQHGASPLAAHAARTREGAGPLEGPGSADLSLSPQFDGGGDLAAEIARIRQIRKPLGALSQKLALEVRRGYHRHWFNDTPGRVDEAVASGWAHVLDKDKKPLKRVVGAGRDNGALYAYAMELPEVFWLEDMQSRHDKATEKVEALKKSPVQSRPGEAQKSDGGKFYSPQEDMLSVRKA